MSILLCLVKANRHFRKGLTKKSTVVPNHIKQSIQRQLNNFEMKINFVSTNCQVTCVTLKIKQRQRFCQ